MERRWWVHQDICQLLTCRIPTYPRKFFPCLLAFRSLYYTFRLLMQAKHFLDFSSHLGIRGIGQWNEEWAYNCWTNWTQRDTASYLESSLKTETMLPQWHRLLPHQSSGSFQVIYLSYSESPFWLFRDGVERWYRSLQFSTALSVACYWAFKRLAQQKTSC